METKKIKAESKESINGAREVEIGAIEVKKWARDLERGRDK